MKPPAQMQAMQTLCGSMHSLRPGLQRIANAKSQLLVLAVGWCGPESRPRHANLVVTS